MVATTILLDRGLAFGTLLGIGGYPVGRLRVILALLQPLLDQHAWTRSVIIESTPKAKWVPARTSHRRYDAFEL